MTTYQPLPAGSVNTLHDVPVRDIVPVAAIDDRATVQDRMSLPDLQISDDVLVDTASDILRSAHVGHILVRGHDGRCTGLLTSAQLGPYRRATYAGGTSVNDIVHDRGPFAHTSMPASTAQTAMRTRALEAWPVVDHDGYSVGLLARERV
ncbi:CBS domain-containing protein [Kitasatospora sp. NBC_00240]|uniref:CBS domain-containing protein n=1 Tax=Kitasatospora sp. NBC_00240 TaxID=2903567 RepID=UPI0022534191|nr:CBS domain-containing protein [Kitasatospora sp. NBC_00240]MCX5215960.1 CBS domain-containing protein [Kitasatospora sp. NBC_00240]